MNAVPVPAQAPDQSSHRRIQRLKLLAILLVCAAPVIASYLFYYVFPPMGRTNFGTLIEPQRPVPALALTQPDGKPYALSSLLGQWVLVQADAGACAKPCQDKLYALRQHRTMTGKERERIDRVWFVTDAATIAPALDEAYAGTIVLRADPSALAALLPVEPGHRIEDYLYLIDPMGNLMMRFPIGGDPKRIHKDITRLLKASRVG
jgi:cytochrome oxidase Cu insertion factor (SCO1/SenC/PrrC family)